MFKSNTHILSKYNFEFAILRKRSSKMDEFEKDDKDKIQVGLIDPQFILNLADVLTQGAKKYGKDNWQKCDDESRYLDATYRHLLAYHSGVEFDEETNLPHLAHAAANLMFLSYFDNV